MRISLIICVFLSVGVAVPAISVAASLEDVVTRYRGSVVLVEVELEDRQRGAIVISRGTGFVISESGFVVTAAHVITPSARQSVLRVTAKAGSRYGSEELMEIIPLQASHDVALLKFRNTAVSRRPLPPGNPSEVGNGELLYVMGFPVEAEWFQDQGSLSGQGGTAGTWTTTLAFDESISGAPVLNTSGQVIAIAWGEIPETNGLNNRIIPINLLYQAWNAAGVPQNNSSELDDRYLTPSEQLAKRVLNGILLQDGMNPFPVFHDGTNSVTVAKQDGQVIFVLTAAVDKLPVLRIRSGSSSTDRSIVDYSLLRSGIGCVETFPASNFGTCKPQTRAVIAVEDSHSNGNPVKRITWRIPSEDLDYRDECIHVQAMELFTQEVSFKLRWGNAPPGCRS